MNHAPTGLAILNSSGPERGSEGRVGRDESRPDGIGDIEFIRP